MTAKTKNKGDVSTVEHPEIVAKRDTTPYGSLVDEAIKIHDKSQQMMLVSYYEMGAIVNKLTENRAAIYGNNTVINLVKDMCEKGRKIAVSTMYAAKAINTHLKKEQYEIAKKNCLSVHSVACLCSGKVSDEVRDEGIKRLAAGELQTTAVSDWVQEKTSGKKSDGESKTGNPDDDAALRAISGMTKLMRQIADKRPAIGDAVVNICKTKDTGEINGVADQIEALATALDELSVYLEKELETANKALAKVKAS